MKKIFVLSLGCSRNLVDSEVLSGQLEKAGFCLSESAEDADIAIVNTCGFIADAKKESIDCILQLAEMKKSGKISRLLVTGCLAQRYSSELFDEIKEIDAVFGSSDFSEIPLFLAGDPSAKRKKKVSSSPGYLYDHNSPRNIFTPGHFAYVKIQEGCSNRCSYCVIPSLKGSRRSRELKSVVSEVKALKKKYGLKEAVLVGQDTTSFGFDAPGGEDISDLIREVSAVMDDGWVRLLYTHPAHFTDRLIKTISTTPNVCRYVDIPIQHVNDTILDRMNRKVTKKDIQSLIDRIRLGIDGVVLRTSVILGFPGETEKRFRELFDFISEVKFERLGAFVYSREEGTPAFNFSGQVPEKVKKERFSRIMEIQQTISAEKNDSLIGRVLEVIIDEPDAAGNGIFKGRSYMDAPEVDGTVYVSGKDLKPGEFVNVKISSAAEYDLKGDVV